MDNVDVLPNRRADLNLWWTLEDRLAELETIPADPTSHYEEPINDTSELGKWSIVASNEFTFGKLQNYAQPEANTAGLAVGSTQGFQLLGMYPELAALDIVDDSEVPTTGMKAVSELLLRVQQLTGKLPTAELIILMLRDEGSLRKGSGEYDEYVTPLYHRILELPPAVSGQQHTFSHAELDMIDAHRRDIASDLERQLAETAANWLQPENLARIANMYRDGKIQIHRGNICGGEVMDHLRQHQPPFGLVYLSNIIGIGHEGLNQAESIAAAVGKLPFSDQPIFIQAVSYIRKPDGHWLRRQHGYSDWPYFVQHGLRPFMDYVRNENPDVQSAQLAARSQEESGGITIDRYPASTGHLESFQWCDDGVLIEYAS